MFTSNSGALGVNEFPGAFTSFDDDGGVLPYHLYVVPGTLEAVKVIGVWPAQIVVDIPGEMLPGETASGRGFTVMGIAAEVLEQLVDGSL